MPGKYSHSVVLADYSSRGVITLPPEQLTKYVKSAPQSHKQPLPQVRLDSTRLASTTSNRPSTSGEGQDAPGTNQPFPAFVTRATSSQNRLSVIAGEDTKAFQPIRYSQYYNQVAQSTPAVNVARQENARISFDVPRRNARTMDGTSGKQDQTKRYSKVEEKSNFLSPVEQLTRPTVRQSRSDTSLRKQALKAQQSQLQPQQQQRQSISPPIHRNAAKNSGTLVAPTVSASAPSPRKTPLANNETNIRSKRNTVVTIANSSTESLEDENLTTATRSRSSRPEPEAQGTKQGQAPRQQSTVVPGEVGRSDSEESKMSRHTQIWDPKPTIDEEPDFDGFSDQEAPKPGYFDIPKRRVLHSRDSSSSSALPIQRPESWDRPKSRDQASNTILGASPQGFQAKHVDRNTPSRTTAASTVPSTRGHRSNSSVSSVSIPNVVVQAESSKKPAAPNKPAVPAKQPTVSDNSALPSKSSTTNQLTAANKSEVPKKSGQAAFGEQSWRLPEIQEDHNFSPSIFEDQESDHEVLSPNPFDLENYGQISSGKDVRFDNDAASELSAALPPPITRFRDEEHEFNTNMTKMFGEGGDYAVSKKGSQTAGPSSTKKSKGFFSRFMSKS